MRHCLGMIREIAILVFFIKLNVRSSVSQHPLKQIKNPLEKSIPPRGFVKK